LPNRFYDRIRHPAAHSLAGEQRTVSGFDHLQGHKYCLLVTYKRGGEPVPTPVWFGLADARLYLRTDANAAKVRRIRNDPRARVAPCSARGKPLGPPADGRVRALDQDSETELGEAALRANYGLGRRIYEATSDALGTKSVYLEVTPA
jgi:PPOX class probable F420-dependent enzyme